jgi:epoxyqueuosine reductase
MRTFDGEALKARLKEQALREGFGLAGVTTPDPLPHYDVYQDWLHAGHHGEMDYLASVRAIARREDPRQIMPQCRSIVVLACNYSTAGASQSGPRVAAYALGDDYHDVFLERMARLATWIEAETGRAIERRSYTDTGPLLERELAQRAGLGWIGKNTCLIHPRMGSYLLLAEMLLDLDLPPDEPFEHDRCGTCRRCIDACPTGCILPNRTLDARRCISYLTIELKGAIPRELRTSIGDWVFGCDICQQVCPWNVHSARPTEDPAFQPRPFLNPPDLQAFLDWQPGKLDDLLRRSPLKRAKRHGLVRNAAVVAGNREDKQYVPALTRILRFDDQAIARGHAAWALGRIGGKDAKMALWDAQRWEIDGEVLEEVLLALKELG